MPAPPFTPPPRWTPVQPFPDLAASRSFVSSDPGGDRLRVAYFRIPDEDRLLARAWFGPGAEGPPRAAHGGSVAAILDEAMGGVCWMNGHHVVAARIGITFLHMVPLGTDATVEAWLDLVDGRKVTARARLLDDAGTVLAEGDGLFIVLPPGRFAEMSKG
ncbi:MAG: PaaI family thioesterase [Vicinamibacterales bacterium]